MESFTGTMITPLQSEVLMGLQELFWMIVLLYRMGVMRFHYGIQMMGCTIIQIGILKAG